MNGERYYTTKVWQRPSSIEFSSAGVLSISMDPRGEPVISTWKRLCQKIQNGSEFPELVAQIFRNPHRAMSIDLEAALREDRQNIPSQVQAFLLCAPFVLATLQSRLSKSPRFIPEREFLKGEPAQEHTMFLLG